MNIGASHYFGFTTKSKGKWGDLDGDGDLDIILYGEDLSGNQISEIYWNKGNDKFEAFSSGFGISIGGSVICADITQDDGDLELIFTGVTSSHKSLLYENSPANSTNNLNAPNNLTTHLDKFDIILKWDSDVVRPDGSNGLSYNVRVGSTPGGIDIISPMSDLVTGKRRLVSTGNTGTNKSWKITGLPLGTYYWSVQAIDQAFNGSVWADEQTFTVTQVSANFSANNVCEGNATQFHDLSLCSGGTIDAWEWDFGDGSTATGFDPMHTYADGGTFNVTLVANYREYSHSITLPVTVRHSPVADFIAQTVCKGTKTSFISISSLENITNPVWLWSFGDGDISNTAGSVDHLYASATVFNTSLIIVADNGCADTTKKSITVAEYPVAAITSNSSLTFCKGDSTILSVPYDNNYIYNWLVNGTGLTGGDTSRYKAKLSGNYSVEVVNRVGNCKMTSLSVSITAQNAPSAPFISALRPVQFCQDDSTLLSVAYNAGYVYQWKLNGGAVSINSNEYIVKSEGAYTLDLSNSNGCKVSSTNTINVIVKPKPALSSVKISGSTSFCQGESVKLSVTGNSGYSYQWENYGLPISSAITNTYSAESTGVYSLRISNSDGCITVTDNVSVSTLPAPAPQSILIDGSLQFCKGDSVKLSVINTAGHNYQWKLDGGIVGSNMNKFYAKISGTYNLIVTNSNGCSVAASKSVAVVVNSLPSVSAVSLSGPTQFCDGGRVIMSIPSTSGYSYNWRNETGLITNATSSSYEANASGTYQLDITNSSGCVDKTPPVEVIVKTMPDKPVIVSENYQAGKCLGDKPITLSASQVLENYNYRWYKNGVPVNNSASSYIEGFLPLGDYSLEVELAGCKAQSDILNIYYAAAPEKPLIYIQGPTIWYFACSNDSASQYKWYFNGAVIPGANTYLYVANNKLGKYNVSVANVNGCFTLSDTVKVPTGVSGIEEVDIFAGLKIFPNPTAGIFTIEMDNQLFGDLSINIMSAEGKKTLNIIFEKSTEHFSSQINLSGQIKGIYIINLLIEKHFASRKLIVE